MEFKMERFPDLDHLANVAEIVSRRPDLLFSPREVEVELHMIKVHSIIRDMGGTDVKLIMKKELTVSDLNSNLSRISIPQEKILADFLEQEECHNLENGGEIAGTVIEPCLRVSNLTLKRWKPFYTLTKGWNAVAHNENNGLEKGDPIQLWSFRTGGSLGFAVMKA